MDRFIVSPEPDIRVIPCQPGVHRCLILATDGLWNVLEPDNVVNIVNKADASNDLRLHRYISIIYLFDCFHWKEV